MSEKLEELRMEIARYVRMVDTPADQYAHNIISLCLTQIDHEYGRAEANNAIEDFDLEARGWHKHDVPEDD